MGGSNGCERDSLLPTQVTEAGKFAPPRPAKSEKERAFIADALRRNDYLWERANLTDVRVTKLADAAWTEAVCLGVDIITQGDLVADRFYVVREGAFDVYVFTDSVASLDQEPQSSEHTTGHSGTLYVGDSFGELALLYHLPRTATVRAKERSLVWVIDRSSISEILSKDFLEADDISTMEDWCSWDSLDATALGVSQVPRPRIAFGDLETVGLLGQGGFGVVELMRHQDTGKTYAMKTMSKGFIMKVKAQQHVLNEKRVMETMRSNFVVRLLGTYNRPQTLHLLMEPMLGGELFGTYHRHQLHGNEKHARYYTACVILAFADLHERSIAYRDLKPENLLLTDSGHVKLSDFGLAKFVFGKTFTLCGTPEYVAPEVISETGHGCAVDWWALGVLIFELMAGSTPFMARDRSGPLNKIMRGISEVRFPETCDVAVKELICGLLQQEPCDRLPMLPGALTNITEHEWYADFDWEGMRNMTLKPPLQPVVRDSLDLTNIVVALQTRAPLHHEYYDDGSNWDRDFAA